MSKSVVSLNYNKMFSLFIQSDQDFTHFSKGKMWKKIWFNVYSTAQVLGLYNNMVYSLSRLSLRILKKKKVLQSWVL